MIPPIENRKIRPCNCCIFYQWHYTYNECELGKMNEEIWMIFDGRYRIQHGVHPSCIFHITEDEYIEAIQAGLIP